MIVLRSGDGLVGQPHLGNRRAANTISKRGHSSRPTMRVIQAGAARFVTNFPVSGVST
jgi:hypothetical protein